MYDTMPCGAPVGVLCLCHGYPTEPNRDLLADLPAAQPWLSVTRREQETITDKDPQP